MREFKVGDRVRYAHDSRAGEMSRNGKVGTIVKVTSFTFKGSVYSCYAVVFDEKVYLGHTLGGLCPDEYGWWCPCDNLELVEVPVKHTAEDLYEFWQCNK